MKKIDAMPASISSLLMLYCGSVLSAFSLGKVFETHALLYLIPFLLFLIIAIFGLKKKKESQIFEFKKYINKFETQDLQQINNQKNLDEISINYIAQELKNRI